MGDDAPDPEIHTFYAIKIKQLTTTGIKAFFFASIIAMTLTSLKFFVTITFRSSFLLISSSFLF